MELNRCALLNKIGECQFVCQELNLYLDSHPDDEAARQDYLCYSQKLALLTESYEAQFGPLMNFGLSPTAEGCWVRGAWPWEV